MTERQIAFLRVVKKKMGDMTQKEFANELGITEATLSRYLTGQREPSLSMIVRMSEVLKCTTDDLLKFDDETIRWALNLHKNT
ncbi:MAG: helix-turn-helix transcriptional regulator [Ruminococcus sp.]|nr:helix-turn-helix transcriptional regulator [Ruminococcus sp.]MBO5319112.1 helix-turn-helix transcriptional regulator [Ruminococcus sp.]